jgi:hypothetical protein
MKITENADRPQCDRIAYYISPDGRRYSTPLLAGTYPRGLIERHGQPYRLLLVVTPQGDDADAIVDRAILAAVRNADASGELAALVDEEQ